MAAILRCGKQMEILPHYYFSWIISFQKQRYTCEMLPLETKLKEQRNILHEKRKRKANWIGHILRRNCFLQRVIEGKIKGGIEVTGRLGRRRRKLLDDLKERRVLSFEGGSSGSHYVDSSLWTCRKTDYLNG